MNAKKNVTIPSALPEPSNTTPTFYDAAGVKAKLKQAGLPSGNTWLHQSIAEGKFAKPVKIGNRNYWAALVVDQFIDRLFAESMAAATEAEE